ncbi:SusC/RagA family TonB-linked outer membrane protein [Pontibacter akesuensis]|uniref:TonB-linked outer membrane protein, SusC/RagA family n=1 Tax=Pontibacter akesuensis TaxID=388950 RepID=A0A1I7IHV8_9BACT|nr:SusC/RagA family TonB-linked outer membrane protein [Pontibacter akesuensis]GHA67263.1 SusC/RagA family TonB-linked outer membrane protein [Pontibacter akesuensis]SFU72524.1 TonB-linked outer membrane protein, SusC/RagA family [Pontibacter akesuensis]
MKKKLLLFLFLVSVLLQQAMAQVKSVSGVVTDAANGQALPGVAVLVKGTTIGTATAADGSYSIEIPAGSNTLVFRYIGYQTTEKEVGNGSKVNVSLPVDTKQLEEVVVTALGYQREKETLPYSVGAVSSENLTYAKSNDVSTALVGKVAGVQIQGSPSSNFDNGNIVIRGANSLSTSQPPIYVVDGTVTDQNAVIMDNVASISVLKGAAATALYGQRAANGVVMITSKRGTRGTPTVELNLSAAFENPSVMMPYQNEYAGGYSSNARTPGSTYDSEGYYIFRYKPNTHPAEWAAFDGQRILDYGADESWGPKINGQLYRPYYSWYAGEDFGKLEPLTAQPDNVKDFYQTGTNFNNSIAFSGGAENFLYRLTYANQNRTLIIPNAERNQHQIGLNTSLDITQKLTASADLSYTTNKQDGRPQEGYRLDGLNVTQNFNQWFQRQLDFERLKNYRNPDGTLQSWNIGDPNGTGNPALYLAPQYWDSPYFVVNENYGTSTSSRLVGNLGLAYEFNDHFSWQSYARMSQRNAEGDFRIATGGLNTDGYSLYQNTVREMNYETNLLYKRAFGDFSVDALLGGNLRKNYYNQLEEETQGGLSFPNFFDMSASIARPLLTRGYSRQAVRSIYGRASFGYKSFLFIDVTNRNDWSSVLPEQNNRFMYPSIGGSFVFTEVINNQALTNVLSSGKLRASWAQVGADLAAYSVFTAIDDEPLYGSNPSAEIGNEFRTGNIKPSLTTSWEVGTDLRFFNAVGVEFTYYQDDNEDQILSLNIDPATGFSTYQINAGKIQRKGIEASITAQPLRGDFTWDIALNIGRNRSKIVELADGLQTYLAATQRNDTRLEHRVGQEWGLLVGRMWKRDDQGRVIVGSNGIPLYEINKEKGTIQPDLTGGLFNNFSYKGISLAFSLDFQKGGLFHSLTKQYGWGSGLHEATVGVNDKGNDWRDFPSNGGGILIPGVYADGTVIGGENVGGQPNQTYIPARTYFYTSLQRDQINSMVIDASYLKLREVRLGYELPASILGTMVKSANIGLMVSNAWLISAPGKDLGIDPSELEETWYEGGQLPSTRTMGVNLRVRL